MNALPLAAYALSALVLLLKFAATAGLQGIVRMRTRTFQYDEDAAYFKGEVRAEEAPLVVRAQRLLRNDSEGQPLFLALGAAFVLLAGPPIPGAIYFGVYTVSRLFHAWFLLSPRQPHRNRAFGLGLTTLLVLGVHTAVLAASTLRG